jgi:uncharacterized membrane protein YdjX (TVP38/TMEM64 family)
MIVMLFKPEVFSAENIAAFLQHFRSQLWLTYFFVSFVRGFFLIPSTPFIFAGIILFPEDTFLLLFTAVAGVVFSSAMLYFYSDNLGFSQYLERYFPVQLAKVKELLKGKYAFPLVFIWSIFPFVPTDLVSYAAGLIKMPVSKVLAGIAIGELILASLYLYFGRELLQIFGAFIEYYQ